VRNNTTTGQWPLLMQPLLPLRLIPLPGGATFKKYTTTTTTYTRARVLLRRLLLLRLRGPGSSSIGPGVVEIE
jgi:hypothetical protein